VLSQSFRNEINEVYDIAEYEATYNIKWLELLVNHWACTGQIHNCVTFARFTRISVQILRGYFCATCYDETN